MYHSWNLPEPDRLTLLETLAATCKPSFHALIGLGSGHELVALAHGLRSRILKYPRGQTPADRLRCFHWGIGLKSIQRMVHHMDRCRKKRRYPMETIVSFIAGDEGGDGWGATVEKYVEFNARFGLVVHIGKGKSQRIRDHLVTLAPLMDHRTTIVLCNIDARGSRHRFHSMLRKGWSGVMIANLGILQRHRLPVQEPQTCTSPE